MKRLLAAATILALCACSAPKREPPPKPFVGTKWQVQLELPIEGEQPHFRFGDGRMEGFGGCNRIVARFVQDTVGSRFIAIGRIESGMKACDHSRLAAERRMLEVLQSVSSYSVTGDRMTMTGSAGTLKFRSDPPNEEKP